MSTRIILSDEHSGWKKDMQIRKRRNLILRESTSRVPEKYLEAGRKMQALSNLNQDYKTKVEARRDAQHFFKLYHKYKNK